MELGDAVSRLRATLDNAVDELSSFRRATQQRYQEDTAALFEEQRALLARHADLAEQAFVSAAKGFQETSVEFNERTKAVNSQASTLVGRLERLGERIAAVRVDPGLVERRAEPLGLALDKLALRLGEMARVEEHREKATEAVLARLVALVDKLTEQLTTVSQAGPAAAKLEATVGARKSVV
jgi:chromosome segregation ATPase